MIPLGRPPAASARPRVRRPKLVAQIDQLALRCVEIYSACRRDGQEHQLDSLVEPLAELLCATPGFAAFILEQYRRDRSLLFLDGALAQLQALLPRAPVPALGLASFLLVQTAHEAIRPEQGPDPRPRLLFVLAAAAQALLQLGYWDDLARAVKLAGRCQALRTSPPVTRFRLELGRAALLARGSERSLGLARLGRLARAANREDDRLGAGLCLLVAGEACLDQNLPRSARSLLDEARRYFDPSREPELVQLAALKKAWAHLDLGEFGTAAERTRELARLETFPRSWRWSLCWLQADLFYHLKGPWPEIRYWLNRAHEELKGRFLKAPLDRLEEQIRAFELLADSAARPAVPLRPGNALRVAQEAARLLRRRFELPLGEEFKFSLWEES